MEIEKPGKIGRVLKSAASHNERNPGEDEAKRFGPWRQVIQNVNRLSNVSFSQQMVNVLLARQRLTESEPSRAPSPAEQPPRQADIIPVSLKKAAVDAAKTIRRIEWENKQ